MSTEPQRICPSCGNEFSGAMEFCPVCKWLGHEDVQTTHVYLQADLAMKEKALDKLAPPATKVARFKPRDEVLAFLASL
jgi:integrase/recombinase XerD